MRKANENLKVVIVTANGQTLQQRISHLLHTIERDGRAREITLDELAGSIKGTIATVLSHSIVEIRKAA
jgi:hypothetical protein